jgi:hypothetical protein
VHRLDLAPGRSGDLWFADLLVDGAPLRDLLHFDDPDDLRLDRRGLGPAGENVPVLMHSWPMGLPHEAGILLGTRPSPLPGGRVPLYVCSACGDLGCGAVTMVVDRDRDPAGAGGRSADPVPRRSVHLRPGAARRRAGGVRAHLRRGPRRAADRSRSTRSAPSPVVAARPALTRARRRG